MRGTSPAGRNPRAVFGRAVRRALLGLSACGRAARRALPALLALTARGSAVRRTLPALLALTARGSAARRALPAPLALTARGSAVRRTLPALLVLAALSACGRTTEVREPDLVVQGNQAVAAPPAPDRQARGLRIASARIVVITHGQASDQFWAIVKRGGQDAGRQTGVAVSYRAPDTYDIGRMVRLIDEAAAARPDGLVVSLPDAPRLAPAIRRAEAAGIPVVTINSGSDKFRSLGVLAHVGQPEYRAGFESGERMGAAGVRHAVCVNQEVGNAGLDVRCRAFAAGLESVGGTSRVLAVNVQDPAQSKRRIAQAIGAGDIDGIITLGPGGATPALAALRAGGLGSSVKLATFDLSPEVLTAVRDGQMLFAVDQQPYLQGYLPVVLLAERARHDLFPAKGELIPTGPHFVTQDTAAEAMQLSTEGIR